MGRNSEFVLVIRSLRDRGWELFISRREKFLGYKFYKYVGKKFFKFVVEKFYKL